MIFAEFFFQGRFARFEIFGERLTARLDVENFRQIVDFFIKVRHIPQLAAAAVDIASVFLRNADAR